MEFLVNRGKIPPKNNPALGRVFLLVGDTLDGPLACVQQVPPFSEGGRCLSRHPDDRGRAIDGGQSAQSLAPYGLEHVVLVHRIAAREAGGVTLPGRLQFLKISQATAQLPYFLIKLFDFHI